MKYNEQKSKDMKENGAFKHYRTIAMAEVGSVYKVSKVEWQGRFTGPGRSSITKGCIWNIKKGTLNLGSSKMILGAA